MRYRGMIRYSAVLGLTLVLSAAGAGRGYGQGGGGASGGAGGAGGGGGSSSGTTVSGGFTGGGQTSSGGFTGGGGQTSSGGFTGGGTSGTSFSGGTGGAGTTVPNSSSAFSTFYGNPLVAGSTDVTGKQMINKAFGQAMYNVISTAAAQGAGNTNLNNSMYGFNTHGMVRTPVYSAQLNDDVPRVVHTSSQLQTAVVDVLRRSNSLQTLTPLRVRVDQGTIFLEGMVASGRMRRLAENLIRLTPGVYDVVNNIEVSSALPTPRTSP